MAKTDTQNNKGTGRIFVNLSMLLFLTAGGTLTYYSHSVNQALSQTEEAIALIGETTNRLKRNNSRERARYTQAQAQKALQASAKSSARQN